MGIGCRLPVPDTRPKIWTLVWIPTPAPSSAEMKTLSIAVRLLSYDAAVFFQDKCGCYHCILACSFVLYITYSYLLENDYIFKGLLPQNETLATQLANAQLIYMNKFLCISDSTLTLGLNTDSPRNN